MKEYTYLLCLSTITAVLCGIWSAISSPLGLLGWAGFAGCTTYFACGTSGLSGIKKALLPNLAGVACGMGIILLSSIVPAFDKTGIWCAIFTFLMCIISKYQLFAFCPGTFMGCFATFAAQGNYKTLIPSLMMGAILGAACDLGSKKLYERLCATTHNNK